MKGLLSQAVAAVAQADELSLLGSMYPASEPPSCVVAGGPASAVLAQSDMENGCPSNPRCVQASDCLLFG